MIGGIIRDIQEFKKSFQQICFQHVPRSANMVAHRIATDSLREEQRTFMLNRRLEQPSSEVEGK